MPPPPRTPIEFFNEGANCKLYNLEWVTPKENAIAAVKHYSKLKKIISNERATISSC
jgi:hypothetical protein